MPLDPEARALLDEMAARGDPPVTALSPEQARAQAEAAPVPGEPPPVAAVRDRGLPGPAGPVWIRVYTPEGDGPFPGVLYFHGGGWVTGSVRTHDAVCRHLAHDAGAVVVSVDYPLAPEHPYPIAAEEGYTALCWLARWGRSLDVDPSRLIVAGDSAGGNLAAVAALMARDRGGPPVALQVLLYPITDYHFDTSSYREFAEGYFLTREAMAWYWGHYLGRPEDGADPYASPLRAERLDGLPPALVVTAEFDPLRDEGEAYAERLRSAGVPVTLRRAEGLIHGFLRRAAVLSKARDVLAEVAAAIRSVSRA